jgi:hypothetical protein
MVLKGASKSNSQEYFFYIDVICQKDFHYQIPPILPTKDGAAIIPAFRDGLRVSRQLPKYSLSDFAVPKEKKDV